MHLAKSLINIISWIFLQFIVTPFSLCLQLSGKLRVEPFSVVGKSTDRPDHRAVSFVTNIPMDEKGLTSVKRREIRL
jgi:hypothetical protein